MNVSHFFIMLLYCFYQNLTQIPQLRMLISSHSRSLCQRMIHKYRQNVDPFKDTSLAARCDERCIAFPAEVLFFRRSV